MMIQLSRSVIKSFLMLLSRIIGRDRIMYYLADEKEIALFHLKNEGFLMQSGWFTSYANKRSIDASNEPIPWLTYSFIDFIKPKLNNDLNIFEFGSGNSTVFFSKRIKSITSVEHDEEWYKSIKKRLPPNSSLIYKTLEPGGAYCKTASDSKFLYDIIIVDGRDRVNCCKNSMVALKANGVVILDDSQREKYREVENYLIGQSFKKIDFCGFAPASLYYKCTTIFYRANNCLNI